MVIDPCAGLPHGYSDWVLVYTIDWVDCVEVNTSTQVCFQWGNDWDVSQWYIVSGLIALSVQITYLLRTSSPSLTRTHKGKTEISDTHVYTIKVLINTRSRTICLTVKGPARLTDCSLHAPVVTSTLRQNLKCPRLVRVWVAAVFS